jgi:WD40 repeat protein
MRHRDSALRQGWMVSRLARYTAFISLITFSLWLPTKGLSQQSDQQTGTPSLDALEKQLEQKKAEQRRQKQNSQPTGTAAQGSDSGAPTPQPAVSPQGFAGTWELASLTMNGVAQEFKPRRITITQDGAVVHIGNEGLRVTSANTIVTPQKNYVRDEKYGHLVPTADQADLVDTATWRIEGSRLVLEAVNDYRTANYYGHPVGKEVRTMVYRRVAEGAEQSVVQSGSPAGYFADGSERVGTIYRLEGGVLSVVYRRSSGQIYSAALGPDQALYFCNANDRAIFRLDGNVENRVYTHTTYVRHVNFGPDGSLYFSESTGAGGDGKIYRLSIGGSAALFKTVPLSEVEGYWAGDFAFDDRGTLWLSSGNRRPSSIYKAVGDHMQRVFGTEGSIMDLVFSKDRSLLYYSVNNSDKSIYRFSLASLSASIAYRASGDSWLP